MGRKCIVRGCKSNYNKSCAKSNEGLRLRNEESLKSFRKIPLYGLPCKKKHLSERQRWIKCIPYLTQELVDEMKTTPAVCRKHWPDNTIFAKGK